MASSSNAEPPPDPSSGVTNSAVCAEHSKGLGWSTSILSIGRAWARRIKRDAMTLWFARSHPDTPWHAKALGAFVVAYALSPIDLIPDFIPILGYVDDVILLPVLIWLTVRLLPENVLVDSRARAEEWLSTSAAKPRSLVGAIVIACIWLVVAVVLCAWLFTVATA